VTVARGAGSSEARSGNRRSMMTSLAPSAIAARPLWRIAPAPSSSHCRSTPLRR
jgi:hypothetical protein